MKRFILALALSFAGAVASAAAADKLPGTPLPAEEPFVSGVSADLTARFPTVAEARRAGYVRYTDEDDTGAISYANRHWTSTDAKHPSQLWYDAGGRLIGADFSVPYAANSTPPNLWGVDPRRWQRFGDHLHYGLRGPDGTTVYGGAPLRRFAPQGVTSVAAITPDNLVTAGIAKRAQDVRFLFEFPAIWDLEVWLIPNRNGAFAEVNPEVHRTGPPPARDMGH